MWPTVLFAKHHPDANEFLEPFLRGYERKRPLSAREKELLPEFLLAAGLRDTPEPTGKGNMLDNTFAMHGSASSSFHLSRNYPIISAGGKNLGFTNGRYLKFGKGNEDNQAGAGIVTDAGWRGKVEAEELPLARLFVTILQRLGVEGDSFAGYTGTLSRV